MDVELNGRNKFDKDGMDGRLALIRSYIREGLAFSYFYLIVVSQKFLKSWEGHLDKFRVLERKQKWSHRIIM